MTPTPNVELPVTWKQLVTGWSEKWPDLVRLAQWVVQRDGGLPEGNVQMVDYERFKAEYEKEFGT